MAWLEASSIDAKVLTLVHDSLKQLVAAALQEGFGGGRGAVYGPVPLVSSLLFQRGKKSRPDASAAQRTPDKTGGRPRREVAVAGDRFRLERGNAAQLASVKRYDAERQA